MRLATLVVFVALQALAAAFAQPVGRVDFAAGVSRIERGTQTILALRGTEVFEGDVITTGPDTQVQIRMADDAFLALRPNSRLALEKYKFNHGAEDGALRLRVSVDQEVLVRGRLEQARLQGDGRPGAVREVALGECT